MKIIQIPSADGITIAVETGKVMYRVSSRLSDPVAKSVVATLKKAISFDSTIQMIRSYPVLQRRMLPNGDVVFT